MKGEGKLRVAADEVAGVAGVVGHHVLADLYGIARDLLRDGAALENVLRLAAEAAGARVLAGHFHSFGADDGVTGVVLLAESHISIHTWPEYEFAAVDIFMCGTADPACALAVLLKALAATHQEVRTEARGMESSFVTSLRHRA